jgi:hypothetical protein
MKKILTLFFILTTTICVGQNWKTIKTEDNISVESSNFEIHNPAKDIHQEYISIRFCNTNMIDFIEEGHGEYRILSPEDLVDTEFSYVIETTYGTLTSTYNSEKDNLIQLSPGECMVSDSIFVKFLPNNQGKILSKTVLNNFNITITPK